MSRSNQPPLWALFGAGGMLSALLGAGLVLFTGIAAPLRWVGPPGGITYAQVLHFAQSAIGKAFILAVISLFLWHAAHRIYHTLHDFGIRTGPIAWACCYGVAFAATVVAAICLIAIGF